MKNTTMKISDFRIRLEYFQQVSDALAFFERHGFTHRELLFWDSMSSKGETALFVGVKDAKAVDVISMSEAWEWERNNNQQIPERVKDLQKKIVKSQNQLSFDEWRELLMMVLKLRGDKDVYVGESYLGKTKEIDGFTLHKSEDVKGMIVFGELYPLDGVDLTPRQCYKALSRVLRIKETSGKMYDPAKDNS